MDLADTPAKEVPRSSEHQAASFSDRARHRLRKIGAVVASVAAIGAIVSGLAGY
jgi:hypothetical protein